MTLANMIAVVTGAGNGIGREIAKELAAQGAELVLVDTQSSDLEVTSEMCGQSGSMNSYVTDICDRTRTDLLFRQIEERWGRLDILVNNAALVADTPLGDTGIDEWRAVLETNLTAPFFWAQSAAVLMQREGFGRIVNISSHAAHRGTSRRSAYGATKAGLEAVTRSMAIDLATHGVTVNAVAPGAIETERTRQSHSSERRSAWTSAIPMGRYGTPEDVAAVVGLLCQRAAGYITGETIRVDGGFTVAGLKAADLLHGNTESTKLDALS